MHIENVHITIGPEQTALSRAFIEALLKGEDMLYPQYDLHGKLQEAMDSWREWAREEARKKLAAHKAETAHPDVIKHWKMLAGEQP